MRKVLLKCALGSILIFGFTFCEDTIEPKTGFYEEYSANLIMRGDTNFHILTITKSYDVDNFDPESYTGQVFVSDAQAELIYNGQFFNFINSSMIASPITIENAEGPFYYLPNLEIDKFSEMDLIITLADGTLLRASTETPRYNFVTFLDSDRSIPPEDNQSSFFVEWTGSLQDVDFSELVFQPTLQIFYSTAEDNFSKVHKKQVPLKKETRSDGINYTFPAVSNKRWEIWSLDIIDDAMENISAGDTAKSNYMIKDAQLTLLVFDDNLGNYFAALQTFLDSYSVRVNEPDVSNIEGGFGVFGSYVVEELRLDVFDYYIKSFGYQSGN